MAEEPIDKTERARPNPSRKSGDCGKITMTKDEFTDTVNKICPALWDRSAEKEYAEKKRSAQEGE